MSGRNKPSESSLWEAFVLGPILYVQEWVLDVEWGAFLHLELGVTMERCLECLKPTSCGCPWPSSPLWTLSSLPELVQSLLSQPKTRYWVPGTLPCYFLCGYESLYVFSVFLLETLDSLGHRWDYPYLSDCRSRHPAQGSVWSRLWYVFARTKCWMILQREWGLAAV